MPDQTKHVANHDYFKGHNCVIPADKLTAYNVKLKGLKKIIFDWICVSADDIRAMHLYKSYATLSQQKYKHYNECIWTIHPFSKLRFCYELLVIFTNVLFPMILTIHNAKADKSYSGLKEATHITYILQVIVNFFAGYIEGKYHKISVVNFKRTCCHYLKTWFVVDLATAVGFLCYFRTDHDPYYTYFDMVKMLQIPKLYIYTQNVMTVMQFSASVGIIIEITIALILYLSWNIYYQFAVEYIAERSYHPENPRNCSWMAFGNIWNETVTVKMLYALDRSVVMFTTNTNMNIVNQENCFSNFLVLGWLISMIMVYHFMVRAIIILLGKESARSNYYIMKTQLDTYMTQRKFPPRIKKKMLNFYIIRFQRNYMAESCILNCLSGQLRDDILMHASRQLVRELPVLQNLPRQLLMQIAFKLRLVIFLAGDIIFKIYTPGDCLYFIDKGTVAIYSQSGKELRHVEDGDYFGEIALVLKHKFRMVSAIAVTNCELYRLGKEDFDTTLAYHSTLYEYFKRSATHKYEKYRVFDEQNRAEFNSREDLREVE